MNYIYYGVSIFCLFLYMIRGHQQLIALGLLYFVIGYLSQFVHQYPLNKYTKHNKVWIVKQNGEIIINSD